VEEAAPSEQSRTLEYVQCLSCFSLVEVADTAGQCPVCGGPVAEEAPEPDPAAVSRKDLLSGLLKSRLRGPRG